MMVLTVPDIDDILNYIHGGEETAILGAWDFVAFTASKDIMDKLIEFRIDDVFVRIYRFSCIPNNRKCSFEIP